MTKGGMRLLLVLTIMSAMLLAAAVPSFAQTRRQARVAQSDYIQNVGDALAESGRNTVRGAVEANSQETVQDSLTDNLGDADDTDTADGIAENVAEQGLEVIGDGIYDTGAADALGNDAGTLIDQLAVNDNVSVDDSPADDDDDDSCGPCGAGSTITQEAIVDNVGTGTGVSGENDATGADVFSNQDVDQVASSVGDDGSPISDAYNDAVQDVYTDGITDGITGEAIGSGNVSTTDIVQTADQIHDDVAADEDGTGAQIDQIGDVINDGIGTATSGGNTSTGNHTNSQQTSTQTATAVNTATADSLGYASNRITARNAGVGRASLSTGSALSTGNSSTTTVVSSSTNVATTVDG